MIEAYGYEDPEFSGPDVPMPFWGKALLLAYWLSFFAFFTYLGLADLLGVAPF